MAKQFDVTLKHIQDRFGPDWATILPRHLGLPEGTITTPTDTDLSVTSSQADKLYELSGAAEGLLHLELESSWAGEIADRLLLYNVLARHRKEKPVYSAVMLLRPSADSPAVTGELVCRHQLGEYLRFRYAVVRVWELSSEELVNGPVGLLPLAMLTDDARPRLPELLRRIDRRVADELGVSQDAGLLLTACSQLLGLRYDKETIERLFAGTTMLEQSSTYQLIMDRGRKEGIDLGRQEGRQHTLLILGRKRFGQETEELRSMLESIRDAERLDRLAETVDVAGSWQEWLRS